MATKVFSGSSILWIAVTLLVALYAAWLSRQVDVAREQAQAAQQREQQLVESLRQLAARPQPIACEPEPVQ